MHKQRILLSIDWDFFIYSGFETENDLVAFPGTNKEKKIPYIALYDWSPHEKHPPYLQQAIWLARCVAFVRSGLDLTAELNLRPDRGSVTPTQFVTELDRRLDLSEAPLWFSDSHAFGYPLAEMVKHRAQPIKVILFDAHSDLGYDREKVCREAKENKADCGSWLFHAIREGHVANVDLVFPDWKGTTDWRNFQDRNLKSGTPEYKVFGLVKSVVRAMTWSEWLEIQPPIERKRPKIRHTHLCRSSAWTPPWLDREFEKLTESLTSTEIACLDCSGLIAGKVGGHDSCQQRGWSNEAVIQEVAAWEKQVAQVMEGKNAS